MSRNPRIEEIEARQRRRATWMLAAACFLLAIAGPGIVLVSLVAIGALFTIIVELGNNVGSAFHLLGWSSITLTATSLGLAQLRFYAHRRKGRTRNATAWWTSAALFNLAAMLITIPSAFDTPFIGVPGMLLFAGLATMTGLAAHEELELSDHIRWRDVVGLDIHRPIA